MRSQVIGGGSCGSFRLGVIWFDDKFIDLFVNYDVLDANDSLICSEFSLFAVYEVGMCMNSEVRPVITTPHSFWSIQIRIYIELSNDTEKVLLYSPL